MIRQTRSAPSRGRLDHQAELRPVLGHSHGNDEFTCTLGPSIRTGHPGQLYDHRRSAFASRESRG
jgi:hypothetical protein